jgi:hypothetical protein
MQKMPGYITIKRAIALIPLTFLISCIEPSKSETTQKPNSPELGEVVRSVAIPPAVENEKIICDFESPDSRITWQNENTSLTIAPTTTPATNPDDPVPTRTPRGTEKGLWSLRTLISRNGNIQKNLDKPLMFNDGDTFAVDVMQDSGQGKANVLAAAAFIEDTHGIRVTGDFYPVAGKWLTVPLDLEAASRKGIDLESIAIVGVSVLVEKGPEPIDFRTDHWAIKTSRRTYWPIAADGSVIANPKGFYAHRAGGTLQVGVTDQWRISIHKRAGHELPWLEVARGKGNQIVIGKPGTGLLILDQDGWNALEKGVQRGAVSTETILASVRGKAAVPKYSWPGQEGDRTTWDWRIAWSSPIGIQVDIKETAGRFDDVGRSAAIMNWKMTIYRTGLVYIHAEWVKESSQKVVDPVSWALVMDRAMVDDTRRPPERILTGFYAPEFRAEVMPHQMQLGNPVAMLARSDPGERDLWWWTEAEDRRIFGVGLPKTSRARGPVDCLLLVNDLVTMDKDMISEASAFSAYLTPPTLKFREGSLDRDTPGDRDNDGMAEMYGFQVIRLANGRAVFTIDPGERPIVAPTFLLTVPPAEHDKVDLKRSHVLINVDGKQFEDPPQWPDGSFLWQYPGILSRPVRVEVELAKKNN